MAAKVRAALPTRRSRHGLTLAFPLDIAKEILYSAANVRGNFVAPRESFVEMNRALETRGVKPIIDKTFTFDQLKEAYEYMQSGSHVGKIVVSGP